MSAAAAVSTAILVVEDEILVRMFAVDALEDAGFRVLQAGTAAEAMQALRGAPDVRAVVVDMGLPDRPGDQLAAEIQALRADLPIVIASGRSGRELRERFAGNPRVAILVKPYTARCCSRCSPGSASAVSDGLRPSGSLLPQSPDRILDVRRHVDRAAGTDRHACQRDRDVGRPTGRSRAITSTAPVLGSTRTSRPLPASTTSTADPSVAMPCGRSRPCAITRRAPLLTSIRDTRPAAISLT